MLIVAITSAIGLANIPDELRHFGGTLLQQTVQIGGALHSVLGVALLFAMLRRPAWAVPAAIAWTLVVAYTAGAATLAWEEEWNGGVLTGAAAAVVSCSLLGALVIWASRQGSRHIPAISDPPASSR